MRHYKLLLSLEISHGNKVDVSRPHSNNGVSTIPAVVDGKPAQPHGEML
jgi:hypothetical protein